MGKVMTTENTGGIVPPPQRPKSEEIERAIIERCVQVVWDIEIEDGLALETRAKIVAAIHALMKNGETK
jgi:precorrin isomerase